MHRAAIATTMYYTSRILIVGDQYFPDNRISLDIIADACRNAPRPLKIYVYRRPAHKPPEPVTISLLDSDDAWDKTKLEKQKNALAVRKGSFGGQKAFAF